MKKAENTSAKKPLYEAAVYLRLSKEDEDIGSRRHKEESNSITNQKRLIHDYLRGRQDIHIFREYVDDGYSGSDFQRPAFLEMMKDVKEGAVSLVIVKDLSRFGREYIEAGRYLQKIFPALGVRFIAVTDHYDSLTADGMGRNLLLPVKNFINDAYSADLSVKIKSHLESRRANGDYTGAYVSYGFLKDKENPNRLVADPEAGEAVRQIFFWKMDGMSNRQIADRLNALGILPPADYKRSIGIHYKSGFQKNIYSSWSPAAVGRILSNPLCHGLVVQGKRERINHKIKKMVERPKEEQIRFLQKDLALVGEKQFETMQCLLKKDVRANPEGKGAFLFSGTLGCPDCGRQLIRRQTAYKNKKTVFYICKTYNVEKGCTRHSIKEEELSGIVKMVFAGWMEPVTGAGCAAGIKEGNEGSRRKIPPMILQDSRSKELEKELLESREMLAGLLGDWQEGILTEEEYQEMQEFYTARRKMLENQIRERKKAVQEAVKSRNVQKGMEAGVQVKRSLLTIFFDRIWVYEDKRVEMVFRCREPLLF